ncbi:unnamed protein product [Rhizoctonia solani]|uniref:Uncharacterized protein n=1 Tax=Rhizoctonia solani TaxID=456999 RepID=A0A8H3EBT4_9AGAM|nr:unnamed protein product [Rhizoctonia solani]
MDGARGVSGAQFEPHKRKSVFIRGGFLSGCSLRRRSQYHPPARDNPAFVRSVAHIAPTFSLYSALRASEYALELVENFKIAGLVMSSPATTASSIPTTPTTPFSLPSPVPFDAPMITMPSSSNTMSHLALPPPLAVRPRRYALHPSFKLQPPPITLKSRTTIIEEQEDEEGCIKIEIHVPSMEKTPTQMSCELKTPRSATRPNKTFADAVAGRNPPPPAPIASASMTFGQLSGQPRSTRAGGRTHRRAQSISMSVSDSVGLRRTSDQHVMRRDPSPRMVHFATIPEAESESRPLARAAHPRVSALAPPHPGLRPSYGLAPPSRFTSREESTPRALVNSGRIIALPSFEDDAFTSMRGSSYAFGANPVAIAVGRGFEQWGQ